MWSELVTRSYFFSSSSKNMKSNYVSKIRNYIINFFLIDFSENVKLRYEYFL